MPEENIELTPIEQSRADTGRRYFAVHPNVYLGLAAGVNQTRNFPEGMGTPAMTLTGLTPIERLKTANDGSGFVLLSLEVMRFTTADDGMIAEPVAMGLLVEKTKDEFMSLQPVEEEEEEVEDIVEEEVEAPKGGVVVLRDIEVPEDIEEEFDIEDIL